MRPMLLASALCACLAAAPAARADRYVLLAATKSAAFSADLDLRKDMPEGHVLYEVEKEDLNDTRVRYRLITVEADCAGRRMNIVQSHAMHSPHIEAGPPLKPLPEWSIPQPGTMQEGLLTAGCAPTFPKGAVIDTGDGDRNFDRVLDAAIKTELGLKPTDPLPKLRR